MAKKAAAKKTGPRSAGQPEVEMGNRLRLRRVEQRMSQEELGRTLGVSFQQVQKYEKGVNRIGAHRLEEIAKALNVPLTFFFGGNGKQHEVETLLAIDSNFSLRLLRAYVAIKNVAVQRSFVSLMERVAGTEGSDR